MDTTSRKLGTHSSESSWGSRILSLGKDCTIQGLYKDEWLDQDKLTNQSTLEFLSKGYVLCYHGNCIDGQMAARAFADIYAPSAIFPLARGEKPPAELKGERVVFVDFVYDLEVMWRIYQESIGMIILDHHATSVKIIDELIDRISMIHTDVNETATSFELYSLPDAIFLQSKDLAASAFACLFLSGESEVPEEVYIAHRNDLYLPMSPEDKYLLAYLRSCFSDSMISPTLLAKSQAMTIGQILTRSITSRVTSDLSTGVCRGQVYLTYRDYPFQTSPSAEYPIAFMNYKGGDSSAIANNLARGCLFAFVWWADEVGSLHVSLRSTAFNIRRLAELYGGGGHDHAAGFVLETSTKEHGSFLDNILHAGKFVVVDEWLFNHAKEVQEKDEVKPPPE